MWAKYIQYIETFNTVGGGGHFLFKLLGNRKKSDGFLPFFYFLTVFSWDIYEWMQEVRVVNPRFVHISKLFNILLLQIVSIDF